MRDGGRLPPLGPPTPKPEARPPAPAPSLGEALPQGLTAPAPAPAAFLSPSDPHPRPARPPLLLPSGGYCKGLGSDWKRRLHPGGLRTRPGCGLRADPTTLPLAFSYTRASVACRLGEAPRREPRRSREPRAGPRESVASRPRQFPRPPRSPPPAANLRNCSERPDGLGVSDTSSMEYVLNAALDTRIVLATLKIATEIKHSHICEGTQRSWANRTHIIHSKCPYYRYNARSWVSYLSDVPSSSSLFLPPTISEKSPKLRYLNPFQVTSMQATTKCIFLALTPYLIYPIVTTTLNNKTNSS